MEDALTRLDKLTQEEVWMIFAENPRATHAVDERVLSVDDRGTGVGDRVAGVNDRATSVNNKVDEVIRGM